MRGRWAAARRRGGQAASLFTGEKRSCPRRGTVGNCWAEAQRPRSMGPDVAPTMVRGRGQALSRLPGDQSCVPFREAHPPVPANQPNFGPDLSEVVRQFACRVELKFVDFVSPPVRLAGLAKRSDSPRQPRPLRIKLVSHQDRPIRSLGERTRHTLGSIRLSEVERKQTCIGQRANGLTKQSAQCRSIVPAVKPVVDALADRRDCAALRNVHLE